MNALATLLPNMPTLAAIQRLEAALRQSPEQVDIEPVHYFAPGTYAREITIPAGVVVVGKLHRHDHMIMLVTGEATIYTDQGMKRIVGPKVWTSSAGTKRAIYAHTDATLMTIHATNETDLAALEADIIEQEEVLCLG